MLGPNSNLLLRTLPPQIPRINWSNPITRGLVFAPWPVGNTFYDLVSREWGTVTGTITRKRQARENGHSRISFANVATGSGAGGNDYVLWPGSSTLRGGDIVNNCTLLALGGANASVDGVMYPIIGNTDSVTTGDGIVLCIDSFNQVGRGNILKTNYAGSKGNSAAVLGSDFENQLHLFGFSFTNNGTDGHWFYDGIGTAFSGAGTHGTGVNDSRRARIGSAGNFQSDTTLLACGFMWNRALTPQEYAALWFDLWQLYESDPLFVVGTPPPPPPPAAQIRIASSGMIWR